MDGGQGGVKGQAAQRGPGGSAVWQRPGRKKPGVGARRRLRCEAGQRLAEEETATEPTRPTGRAGKSRRGAREGGREPWGARLRRPDLLAHRAPAALTVLLGGRAASPPVRPQNFLIASL